MPRIIEAEPQRSPLGATGNGGGGGEGGHASIFSLTHPFPSLSLSTIGLT